ncbi:MAG: hypothetical protein K0R14_166 [Burkholderiales bacterium]|jgi:hypothetical protein|nr:hypothetical protein [Burkholderiales bacterium]
MQDTLILQTILTYLLKGIIYKEQNPKIWNSLLEQQNAVVEYFKMIGLALFLDEAEGYAFLRQMSSEDMAILSDTGEMPELPQLIVRRQLNYATSLLCVLLRKKLLEQDTTGGDIRVIISKEQIRNMMVLYLPNRNNETKTFEQIDACIKKLLDLGFLRKLKTNDSTYDVQRIIKAFVDAAWLGDLNAKLEEYRGYANNAE